MFRVIRFILLAYIKIISHIFYSFDVKWIEGADKKNFESVKLFVFLNHTSLYELMFVAVLDFRGLWKLSKQFVAPGADTTILHRPFVGRMFKALFPDIVPISRKNDETWDLFLEKVTDDALVGIFPEGRMMRRSGLDKNGKMMTVRGGVADVLERKHSGNIMFIYSGGMHHIQCPGQTIPRFFKKVRANIEFVSIEQYKKDVAELGHESFKINVIEDLQTRNYEKRPH